MAVLWGRLQAVLLKLAVERRARDAEEHGGFPSIPAGGGDRLAQLLFLPGLEGEAHLPRLVGRDQRPAEDGVRFDEGRADRPIAREQR